MTTDTCVTPPGGEVMNGPEHAPNESATGCVCGWGPHGTHTPRMTALLVETHVETAAGNQPDAEDDR